MSTPYTEKEMKDFLSRANFDLGTGEYDKRIKKAYMFQDFCKAVIIARQLQKENEGLKKLIEEL